MHLKKIEILTDNDGSMLKEPIVLANAWLYTSLSRDSYGKDCLPVITKIQGVLDGKSHGIHEIYNTSIEFIANGFYLRGTRKEFIIKDNKLTEFQVGVVVYCCVNPEV